VIKSVERVGARPIVVKEEPRRAGDPPILIAKADRVRSTLGWKPRLDDLDTIVRTALEWERKLQTAPW
jgi:UDP-glucose 4-epimerase